MSTFVSSNRNRFYVGIESKYGIAPVLGPNSRFPASHVEAMQVNERPKRIDKTGTRTLQASLVPGRIRTAFQIHSYLSAWNGEGEPGYGPLFQAACGSPAVLSQGCVVQSVPTPTEVVTGSPHGFAVGQAICWQNEIRFITAVLNAYTFTFNAPFSVYPSSGVLLNPTVTYRLAEALPSFTLCDYWEIDSVVSRLLSGCAVDSMNVVVNGDYHEFSFSGPASELVDSMSFSPGSAGLNDFPAEPEDAGFTGMGVPGHLGQAWFGSPANQFFTLTAAKIKIDNNLDVRRNEFGWTRPAGIVPGERQVSVDFSVLVQDDGQTTDLYRAAKAQATHSVMLQLGAQQGQLMGVYLPEVVSQTPNYNDSDVRLKWDFHNSLAQGATNDELFIAFA